MLAHARFALEQYSRAIFTSPRLLCVVHGLDLERRFQWRTIYGNGVGIESSLVHCIVPCTLCIVPLHGFGATFSVAYNLWEWRWHRVVPCTLCIVPCTLYCALCIVPCAWVGFGATFSVAYNLWEWRWHRVVPCTLYCTLYLVLYLVPCALYLCMDLERRFQRHTIYGNGVGIESSLVHCALYLVPCTLYCTLYLVHCAFAWIWSDVFSGIQSSCERDTHRVVPCTLCIVPCTLCIVPLHCTFAWIWSDVSLPYNLHANVIHICTSPVLQHNGDVYTHLDCTLHCKRRFHCPTILMQTSYTSARLLY
jgi:hypothetical protein